MEAFYTEHVSEHRRCHKEGCTYVAAQKLVQLHIKLHHNTGLAKKIWNLESKEDIDKWVADRKRNFPTTNNVEKKKSMTEDRIARGEVLNSKSFHHRPRESGRKRHQGYAQHLKQKKFKSDGNVMDPNSKNTDKNADSGTSTSLFPIKNSASDPVSSGLDILQKTYNSDVEDHGELNVTKNNKVSLPKNSRSSELPKLPWESKVFVRYRPTLLEKLLAKEIRHERNIILQCTRYIVENNFFENKTSVELSEISALGSTIDVSPVELQVDGTENNSKQVFMTNTLAKTQTILRTTNLIKMPQFDETERLTESNVQGIKSEDGLVRNVRGVVAVNGLRNNVRGVTSKDSFMKDTKVSESLIGENNGVISEDGLVEGAQDVTSEDGLLEGAQDMTSEDGLLEGVQDLTSEDGLVEGAQHVTSEDGLMDGAQDVTSEDGLVENVQNVTSEDGLVEGAQDVTSGDGLGRCALDVNVEDGLGRCVPDVSFEDGLGRCAPGVTYEDGLVEGAKDVSFDDGLMESTQNVTSEDSLVGFAEDIATKDNLVGCPQGDVSEDGLVQCAMGVFYETKRTEVLQIRKNASPQSTLRIDSTENVLTDKPQNSNTSKDIHIGTPQKSNTSEDIYTGTP